MKRSLPSSTQFRSTFATCTLHSQRTRTAAWVGVYELIADFGAENPLEHYERALREVDRALEVPSDLQGRECLEDARSTRERLRGKIAALEGP